MLTNPAACGDGGGNKSGKTEGIPAGMDGQEAGGIEGEPGRGGDPADASEGVGGGSAGQEAVRSGSAAMAPGVPAAISARGGLHQT